MAHKEIILYVARHGRTVMNEENKFRGDANPPLDANGIRDANELAFYFSGIELSFIVASDKKRASTTADIISLQKNIQPEENVFDLHPVYNDQLRPWNVGDFGGKPKNDENVKELQKYIDNPDAVVPGGTSLSDFRGRVRPLFKEAVEAGIQIGVPGLLVVHSSVIHELGCCFGGDHEAAHVKPGGVAAVYLEGGQLKVSPIFKPDDGAATQNILGLNRSGLSS